MENILFLIISAFVGLIIGLIISNNFYKNTVDLTIIDLIKEQYAFNKGGFTYKGIPITLSYDVAIKKFVGYIQTAYGTIEISEKSIIQFILNYREAVCAFKDYREAIKLKGTVLP